MLFGFGSFFFNAVGGKLLNFPDGYLRSVLGLYAERARYAYEAVFLQKVTIFFKRVREENHFDGAEQILQRAVTHVFARLFADFFGHLRQNAAHADSLIVEGQIVANGFPHFAVFVERYGFFFHVA